MAPSFVPPSFVPPAPLAPARTALSVRGGRTSSRPPPCMGVPPSRSELLREVAREGASRAARIAADTAAKRAAWEAEQESLRTRGPPAAGATVAVGSRKGAGPTYRDRMQAIARMADAALAPPLMNYSSVEEAAGRGEERAAKASAGGRKEGAEAKKAAEAKVAADRRAAELAEAAKQAAIKAAEEKEASAKKTASKAAAAAASASKKSEASTPKASAPPTGVSGLYSPPERVTETAEADVMEAVTPVPLSSDAGGTPAGEKRSIGDAIINAIVEGVRPIVGERADAAAEAAADKVPAGEANGKPRPGPELKGLVTSGDVKKLTVTKLRRLLSDNKLKTSGRKAELIARLTSFANS